MGTPKHTCMLASGITMGAHMAALASTIADVVLTAGGAEAMHDCDMVDAVPDLVGHVGLGPLAGIEAALASGRAERWIVLPCDMPHLTTALLRDLRDHQHDGVVVLQGCGPLPLRINTTDLSEVTTALDMGTLAVRHLPCVRTAAEVAVSNPACLQDVDRPADLC